MKQIKVVIVFAFAFIVASCASVKSTDNEIAKTESEIAIPNQTDGGGVLFPTPFQFVSQLDLECRRAFGPPPVQQLFLRQLNPVLQGQLPDHPAFLSELREMCLPVAKNHQIPTNPALDFIRWVDLACYQADTTIQFDVNLRLAHLNPILDNLPMKSVHIEKLERLCVPVRKNNAPIPPHVMQVISHLDLACYRIEPETPPANVTLTLSDLNPVVQGMGFPDRTVVMQQAYQLCVPVAKDSMPIPPEALKLVEWVDMLKYRLEFGNVPIFPLNLSHLNPLFATHPPFETRLVPPLELLVPVAKNNQFPPGSVIGKAEKSSAGVGEGIGN